MVASCQVFINYGPHDNSFLICEYGFILPTNSFNHVPVDKEVEALQMPNEAPNLREEVTSRMDLHGLRSDHVLRAGELPYRLLMALRARACGCRGDEISDADLNSRLNTWTRVVHGEIDIVSRANERIALEGLADVCRKAKSTAHEKVGRVADLLGSDKGDDGILLE
ncbi:SET domain-containing protein 4 [Borealophlyctis nickersoniae]|nr:SET domain-containing protein 4 [Borealophlyctis nickersoniae]